MKNNLLNIYILGACLLQVAFAATSVNVYYHTEHPGTQGLLNALSQGLENSQNECLPLLEALGGAETRNRELRTGRQLPCTAQCNACYSWGTMCTFCYDNYCHRRSLEHNGVEEEIFEQKERELQTTSQVCIEALADVETCITNAFPGLGVVDQFKQRGTFGCVEYTI